MSYEVLVSADSSPGTVIDVKPSGSPWGKKELCPSGQFLLVGVEGDTMAQDVMEALLCIDHVIEPDYSAEPTDGEEPPSTDLGKPAPRWRLNFSELDQDLLLSSYRTKGRVDISEEVFENACESRQGHRFDRTAEHGQGEVRPDTYDHSTPQSISEATEEVDEGVAQ